MFQQGWIAKHDGETMRQNLAESFKPHPDIDVGAMRNFRAATVRQLEARTKASETFMPWLDRSPTTRSWIALQQGPIDELGLRLRVLDEILERLSS
jgi:hypothetical protein